MTPILCVQWKEEIYEVVDTVIYTGTPHFILRSVETDQFSCRPIYDCTYVETPTPF